MSTKAWTDRLPATAYAPPDVGEGDGEQQRGP